VSVDAMAVLLGRKGSKQIVGKNTMEVLGRPICHYSILAALNSAYVRDVYVTTDDDLIMAEARRFDLDVIERPANLCTDEALFETALLHGYREAVQRRGSVPDYVVILMCNVMTITSGYIDLAIDALENDSAADSAVTVTQFNMYSPLRARKVDDFGYLQPFVPFEVFGDPATLNCDRGSQGDVLVANMSHSVSRSAALEHMDEGLLPQKWMGRKILPIFQDFGCDLDASWQIAASVSWARDNGFSDTTTPYDTEVHGGG